MSDADRSGAARSTPAWIPVALNHSGRPVPALLGPAIMAFLVLVVLVAEVVRLATRGHLSTVDERLLADLGGLLLVFGAGFYDDHGRGPHRGLRGHLRELARGRITPGTIKLIAAVAAGALIAAPSGQAVRSVVLGVPVMAGSANLWNLLDVRPGRAIKYFIPAAALLAILGPSLDFELVGVAALVAAVAVLWPDLGEVAMLGDSGSNLLGLVVGIGLFRLGSIVGLALALGAILALHVLAETVTLSRIIEAAPPLRWFDRLGRQKNEGETERPPASL